MYDYYKYLGAPYKFNGSSISEGFDCINLCIQIGKDRGINIPNINHKNNSINNYFSLFNIRNDNTQFKKVQQQKDVLVVFKVGGRISHVGYMLDNDNFIHIMEKSNVSIERISDGTWKNRVIGFYKYIGN